MRPLKTAFIAVFSLFFLSPAAPAADLNTLGLEDVQELTADLDIPMPRQALQEVMDTRNGLDPVVITVSGLKFGEIGAGPAELRNLIRFLRFFFRNKDITEADVVNGVVSFSPRYFFPEEDPEARDLPSMGARLEDNYLEVKLKEIPGYEQHDVVVVPFRWSRDPGDTKPTLPQLQEKIIQVYDEYKDSGRPIYILAHSWGSVMTHTALHRIHLSRPDVRIDKLITAGSPLVPGNIVVKLFLKIEKMSEGLERKVRKPANVDVWRNIWAMRDAYSNAIPAADTNYQADAEVENLEPTLIQLILHNKLLKKEARRDLFKMRDIKAWHGAYFFDYRAELKSLQKEIFVPVFQPVLAPQVVNCAKTPAMCRP
ncbi:MAG: hypothetical protein A2049_06670 [Elusimicrobia bacterium GWA2_62_23]|nr:MAG: hypothetical protein A2049_06670 [Elusimicrobia bacterium GWA2_62_23]